MASALRQAMNFEVSLADSSETLTGGLLHQGVKGLSPLAALS
jgi:hypothetical protein